MHRVTLAYGVAILPWVMFVAVIHLYPPSVVVIGGIEVKFSDMSKYGVSLRGTRAVVSVLWRLHTVP
jgi:hypothetical protein